MFNDVVAKCTCGGDIIFDSDFVLGPDDEEYWWTFKCTRCGEVFQTMEDVSE